MTRPPGWRRLFRIGRFRGDIGTELDDELDFHFQESLDRLEAQGKTREEAIRETRRRFGDAAGYRRKLERIGRKKIRMDRWTTWLAGRVGDVRHSVRALARQPAFAGAVVLTFALGIGANAALFGIVDRLLLEPPAHIRDSDSVVRLLVERSFLGRLTTSSVVAWDDLQDLKAAGGLSDVAGYTSQELTLGEGEGARRIEATMATADFFTLLGVQAETGRLIGADDDRFGAPLVAVLGHQLWRGRFGSDPEIVGKTILLAGKPYTVVGVAPGGFTGVGLSRVDVWLPLRPARIAIDGDDRWFSSRGNYFVRMVARLAPGASSQAAMEEAARLHRAGREESIREGHYAQDARIVAQPLVAGIGPAASLEGRVALWIGGVSLLVLLIACANVANLFLARGMRQWRESAMRLALGISPWRLLEQRVLDALVLALAGGAVGLAVAWWGGGALRETLLPQVDWTGLSQFRVIWFALGVSILAGLVAGSMPALLAARQRLAGILATGGRTVTRGRRVRSFLAVGQATLAAILLVGAGLFVLSLRAAREANLGFDPDRLLMVRLDLQGEPGTDEQTALYMRALERVASLPGVASAALTTVPFGWSMATELRAEGLDSIPSNPTGGPYYHYVSQEYFRTLGIRVLRGRTFRPSDYGGASVAVMNAAMGHLLWPNEDPLGRCLYVGEGDPPCTRVIGVTAYAHQNGIVEEESPQYYLPLRSEMELPAAALFVRASGDPSALVPPLTRDLASGLTGVRFANVQPMRSILAPELRGWRLGSTIFSLFGILALLVAWMGMYGLLAFDVAERRRDIGIRMALGSPIPRIRRDILLRALLLAAMGVSAGVAIAWMSAPFAADLLFGVSPRSPVVFGASALVLLSAAASAGVLPARRATQVQPTEALRED